MALNDISGQLKPWMRRTVVDDVLAATNQSIASRLTTHSVLFQKTAADGAAGDATDDAFYNTVGESYILAARIIPHAALTADGTNYTNINLWDGTTQYTGNLATNVTSWTDNVPVDFTVTTSSVADDTTLRFRIQKVASGVVVPVLVLQVLIAERIA